MLGSMRTGPIDRWEIRPLRIFGMLFEISVEVEERIVLDETSDSNKRSGGGFLYSEMPR
jgi:hypothetical protein